MPDLESAAARRSTLNSDDLTNLSVEQLASEIAAGRVAAEVLSQLDARKAAAVADAVRSLQRNKLLRFVAQQVVLHLNLP